MQIHVHACTFKFKIAIIILQMLHYKWGSGGPPQVIILDIASSGVLDQSDDENCMRRVSLDWKEALKTTVPRFWEDLNVGTRIVLRACYYSLLVCNRTRRCASCNCTPRLIANEQAERRRSACEVASLMPREVLQQTGKFSIVLWKV